MASYDRIKVKEDIKAPDEFISFWDEVFVWLQDNYMKVVVPVVLIIAGAISIGGMQYYDHKKEISSQKDFYAVLAEFPREGTGEQGNPDQFKADLSAVADKYNGSFGGNLAQLYKANMLYRQKLFDKADVEYGKAVKGGGADDIVASLAALGQARSRQNLGQYEQSSNALKTFISEANPLFREEMDFITAQNLELSGNSSGAAAAYQQFLNSYPDNQRAAAIKEKLSHLSK